MPSYRYEREAGGIVAGVDEAGRGPLAGPVVAAAVIIYPKRITGIDDSKKLTTETRETLFATIMKRAQVGVGIASVEEIDTFNILGATLLTMQRAVAALPTVPDVALIDGNKAPILTCRTQTIISGDALSLSIAAASIIAKVTRDRLMCELASQHPHYGWEKNAGYGTKLHQKALAEYGVTPHHRRSFAPIRALVEPTLFEPV